MYQLNALAGEVWSMNKAIGIAQTLVLIFVSVASFFTVRNLNNRMEELQHLVYANNGDYQEKLDAFKDDLEDRERIANGKFKYYVGMQRSDLPVGCGVVKGYTLSCDSDKAKDSLMWNTGDSGYLIHFTPWQM